MKKKVQKSLFFSRKNLKDFCPLKKPDFWTFFFMRFRPLQGLSKSRECVVFLIGLAYKK